eukprot:1161806-Pelagomonas_calceolata.AAC.5
MQIKIAHNSLAVVLSIVLLQSIWPSVFTCFRSSGSHESHGWGGRSWGKSTKSIRAAHTRPNVKALRQVAGSAVRRHVIGNDSKCS